MGTPDRLGDFEIVEEIGRGGFGIVYRARQLSLDRPVAVKVLFRHLIHTQDEITRFEREARAAARLDHPAIVSVYAWGQANDDFYIAQRLVGRGRTLADELAELRTSGTPPKGHFRRVAEVVAHVAEGLQQAHDRGIVHRDVKPSNILLDEHDRPCLSDFGLAKIEDGLELSRTGDFAGSPYFMSPEQADGRRGPVDHRSDIYSLGVTLYELLTLTQPFQGSTAHEIVRKILADDPRRPRRIESRVPADLETICLKAMERNPAQRYPSSLEFAHDLRSFLDGEPISAVPIGITRRGLRAMRRHREPVAYALLVTLLVGGGLWASLALSESTQQVDRAQGEAALKSHQVDEISQLGERFTEQIRQAAADQDPAKVSELVQQQQLFTQVINDNYAWVNDQLTDMGDSEALKQVAAGVATGGLYGGLQSLQQIIVTQKAEQERETLMSEVNRRMGELAQQLMAQRGTEGAATGADAAAAAEAPAPWASLPLRLLPGGEHGYLLLHGQLIPLTPRSQPQPPQVGEGSVLQMLPAGASEGSALEGSALKDSRAGGGAGAGPGSGPGIVPEVDGVRAPGLGRPQRSGGLSPASSSSVPRAP
jgi:serine/threonine protein kinase